jgi:hypothetical protein
MVRYGVAMTYHNKVQQSQENWALDAVALSGLVMPGGDAGWF